MIPRPSSPILLILALLFIHSSIAFVEDGAFAGMIQEITCAEPKLAAGPHSEEVALDKEKDLYRPLALNSVLRCEGKGSIKVSQGGKMLSTSGANPLPLQKSIQADILGDLPSGFTPAGSRGDDDVITYPPADGRIRASDFFIEWHPPAGADKISLVLETAAHQKLCCEGSFEGKPRIEVPTAISTLTSFRDRNAADLHLILKIVDANERDSSVEFSLLSADDDRSLTKDLAAWDASAPLLKRLGRAFIFRRYGLSRQEASELEQALAASPNSPYLIARCLEAQRRANNSARVQELSANLPSSR